MARKKTNKGITDKAKGKERVSRTGGNERYLKRKQARLSKGEKKNTVLGDIKGILGNKANFISPAAGAAAAAKKLWDRLK